METKIFTPFRKPRSKSEIKTDICAQIRSFDRQIKQYREQARYWQAMIELAHHNIKTYTPHPFEETNISEYIADLEEAKFCYNDTNDTLYKLKKTRNEMQRQQNLLK